MNALTTILYYVFSLTIRHKIANLDSNRYIVIEYANIKYVLCILY